MRRAYKHVQFVWIGLMRALLRFMCLSLVLLQWEFPNCNHIEMFESQSQFLVHAGELQVVMKEFDAGLGLATIAKKQVTVTALGGVMAIAMVSSPLMDEYNLESMRLLSYGGSALSKSVLQQLQQSLQQCTYFNDYG